MIPLVFFLFNIKNVKKNENMDNFVTLEYEMVIMPSIITVCVNAFFQHIVSSGFISLSAAPGFKNFFMIISE